MGDSGCVMGEGGPDLKCPGELASHLQRYGVVGVLRREVVE